MSKTERHRIRRYVSCGAACILGRDVKQPFDINEVSKPGMLVSAIAPLGEARILLMLNMVTPDGLIANTNYEQLVEDSRIPWPVKRDKSAGH